MFLLKRKRDGKFWNNSGDRARDKWVDDPSTCRPFRSQNAVRHSRACYGAHPSFGEGLRGDSTMAERRAYWAKSVAWYADANRQGRTDYFNSLYTIIPVTVTMVLP